MSKKIVVITGSPRKNGNSFAMTDAFIKAAEAKGHTVTRFDAAMMNVGGCHACETCFKTGKACSFDDDFNMIAPAILEADTLVFTMRCTGTPSLPRSRGHRQNLFSGSGRQGHCWKRMCADCLLRGGRSLCAGWCPHSHGAYCRR